MVSDITGEKPKRYSEVRSDQAYDGPRIASYQIHKTLRPHKIQNFRWHDQGVIPLRSLSHADRDELLPAPVRPSQHRRMPESESQKLRDELDHIDLRHAGRDTHTHHAVRAKNGARAVMHTAVGT